MTATQAISDADLDDYLAGLKREFPNFRMVDKRDDRLSRAIDVALAGVTLGRQRHYMTQFVTVIGDTLYVPSCWSAQSASDKLVTLRHERVHLLQRRRYTMLGMAILYLFVPLPLGLAYGRANMEREAYEETLRATLELKGERALLSPTLREHIVSQFTCANYGWMWPFRRQMERWYDGVVAELLATRADP
jgi:hypothetical protein